GHTPQIHSFFQGRTRLLEIPGYDVSSSEVRRRLREGRSVRYLLPLEVEVFLGKHGFYRVD
ncbi:MAG: nicotinic acid mononucleotide adenylyltransferase, partial [Armatimonadota bacterium]